MKKSFFWAILGAVAVIAIGAYATSSSIPNPDLDIQRMHGTVDTAMGSPILGNPSAPITIVEFGVTNVLSVITGFIIPNHKYIKTT